MGVHCSNMDATNDFTHSKVHTMNTMTVTVRERKRERRKEDETGWGIWGLKQKSMYLTVRVYT